MSLPETIAPEVVRQITPEQLTLVRNSFTSWYSGVFIILGIIQAIVFHLVSAGAFGWEFNDHALGRLLAQPIPRTKIWSEKMGALALIAFCVLAGNMLLDWKMVKGIEYLNTQFAMNVSIRDFIGGIVQPWAIFTICAALLALANGPLMAMWLRQAHTAFWASLVLPILAASLFGCIDYMVFLPATGFSISDRLNARFFESLGEFNLMALFTIIWCPVPLLLGWFSFKRLEV